MKYLKESCWQCSYQHFSFKYFANCAKNLKDFFKIVRLVLDVVSINGLKQPKNLDDIFQAKA